MRFSTFIAVLVFSISCGPGGPGPAGPPGEQGATGNPGANGATGAMGAMGVSGLRGVTGADGGGFDIVAKKRCFKIAGYAFTYYTALFSNGMRFATCEVADSGASYDATILYASTQVGATTGGCVVTYDVDTASSGWWSFTLSPLRAQYNDIGSASDQQTVTFASTDCTN